MTFKEIMEAQQDFQGTLLPCPFCNGNGIAYCCDPKVPNWTVECYECDCTLSHYPSIEHAVRAWNTRGGTERGS